MTNNQSVPERAGDPKPRLVEQRGQWTDFAAAALIAITVCSGAWLLLDGIDSDGFGGPPFLAFLLMLLVAALAVSWKNWSSSGAKPGAIVFTRTALLLPVAVLTLYVLRQIPALGREADYLGVFLAWVLAILLYLSAFASPLLRSRWKPLFLSDRQKRIAILLFGITLTGALLRLWDLGKIPYIFHGDEASFAIWSLETTTSALRNPFATGWSSQPTMGMFFEGFFLRLTGATIEGARLPWALVGIVTIPAAFFLAARLRGTTVGLATAALFATYHFHIHYSRTAFSFVDPLFTALALLLLVAAIERKSFFAWALVGTGCGLGLYFYQGGRLTPVVVAAVIAYLFVTQRKAFRGRLTKGPLVAAGAFAVVAAPMLQVAFRFPQEFNARLNIVGILQSGWLDREIAGTGQSGFAILWKQFYHSVLAFNVYPDTSEFYSLQSPLLDPLFGCLFLAGLLYATFHALFSRCDWRLLTVVFWWWGGIVLGGVMTISPPSSQRLVGLGLPACFFIALSVQLLVRYVRVFRLTIPQAPAQLAGTILFAAISLKTYFLDFTPLQRSGGQSAALMMELLPVLKTLGPQASVFFVGAPQIYWDFPTRVYLAPNVRGSDVVDPLVGPPSIDLIEKGHVALFVFVPDRIHELAYVKQTFPNGTTSTISSPVDKHVFATIYEASR